VTPVLLAPVAAPTISLSQASLSSGSLAVTYSATTFNGADTVTLYRNSTNSTTGGTPIVTGLPIGANQSTNWSVASNLPSGTYYLYGTMNDGLNAPLAALAAQPVQWTNPNTPSTPTGLAVSAKNGVLHASWQPSASSGITGYQLTLLNSQNVVVATAGTGGATSYDFTGLTTGTSYGVQVAALTASGLASPLSAAVTAQLPAPSFPTLAAQWSASGTTGLGSIVAYGTSGNTTSLAVTDNGIAAASGAPDGSGSFGISIPLFAGTNTLVLTATSPTGDTATATTTITYASAAPLLILTGPAWDGTTTNSSTLTVAGTTDAGNTVTVNGIAATVSSGGQFSLTVQLLAGPNTIIVYATNTVGVTSAFQGSITYTPALSATHLAVSAPASATGDIAFNISVTAQDANNATVPGYTGTVHFTSSDTQAVLPANYTFTQADAGTHTFSVTLKSSGSQTVTATDTASSSITGQATVNVSAPNGPCTSAGLTITPPSPQLTGTGLTLSATSTGCGGVGQYRLWRYSAATNQ